MVRRTVVSKSITAMAKFIDIGSNLTDSMYQGEYHGSKKHEPDLDAVLERSWKHGLEKMIITGGSFNDAKSAIAMAKTDDRLFATVGCHPTRCNEFEDSDGGPSQYMSGLLDLIKDNSSQVVAIGECGLDFDRLNFCVKETQKKYFEEQLKLCEQTRLPLFLHCRNAAKDLLEILERNKVKLHGGVVHSFDGSLDEAKAFIDLGYYIGLNGCSLKTEDNLNVVKELPTDRLLLETDAPWCEIRPSHASSKYPNPDPFKNYPVAKKPDKFKEGGLVKSRNEPCFIQYVLDVVSGVKGVDPLDLANQCYNNTMKLFFSDRK